MNGRVQEDGPAAAPHQLELLLAVLELRLPVAELQPALYQGSPCIRSDASCSGIVECISLNLSEIYFETGAKPERPVEEPGCQMCVYLSYNVFIIIIDINLMLCHY